MGEKSLLHQISKNILVCEFKISMKIPPKLWKAIYSAISITNSKSTVIKNCETTGTGLDGMFVDGLKILNDLILHLLVH